MPDSQSIQEAELVRARGAAYSLIARGFQYPDQEALLALADPARWEHWPDVLDEGNEPLRAALRSVRDAVKAAAEAASDAEPRELQLRYDEIFGHSVRGGCPAYEMEYGRNEIFRQAADLADLAGFYHAFGMEIADDANGRPDHIATECEFMSALCSKETHAYAQRDETNANVCLDAQRAFLRDHLGRWLPALAHRIKEADGEGFFGTLAVFASAFVKAECHRFDVHPGPPTLELRPPDPVLDTQISCGPAGCGEGQSGDQLVQLGSDKVGSPGQAGSENR